jgi:hypothetical protein
MIVRWKGDLYVTLVKNCIGIDSGNVHTGL